MKNYYSATRQQINWPAHKLSWSVQFSRFWSHYHSLLTSHVASQVFDRELT